MSSTNKTTYYELSQYVGTDKPTYLGDYNSDMLAIDTALHDVSEDAGEALTTANTANATATTASENATTALSTAQTASTTATTAQTTAETAATNASAALVAAQSAVETAEANPITNLAPAYDSTLTYEVGDLVTYDGKLYKCIVAVTSAMSFNLNYWDDVTTNEVFDSKKTLIHTTSATASTFADAFSEFFSYLNSIEESKLSSIFIIGSDGSIYRLNRKFTGDIYEFSRTETSFSSSSVSVGFTYLTAYISESATYYHSIACLTSGITVTDYSSTSLPSDRTYSLYA